MSTRSSTTTSRRRKLAAVTDAEIDDVARQMADAPLAVPLSAPQTPLHELFDRQIRDVLDNAGLADEEKQSILVAMACPCCGGGAAAFTYKLKPER